MPWNKTPEDRARDAKVYGAEYKRNRKLALRRAGGKCEHLENGRRCGSTDHVQCDHITAVTAGGTHHLDNLRILCARHHRSKTAQEGGGYRAGRNRGRGRRREADPALQQRTQW